MASQSITSILGKAYDEGIHAIPFHRIVYADGHVWMDSKYKKKRMALYKKEKIEVGKDNKIKNFYNILFDLT